MPMFGQPINMIVDSLIPVGGASNGGKLRLVVENHTPSILAYHKVGSQMWKLQRQADSALRLMNIAGDNIDFNGHDLDNAPNAPRAWAVIIPSSTVIQSNFNVASITSLGSGGWRLGFDTSMSDNGYGATVGVIGTSAPAALPYVQNRHVAYVDVNDNGVNGANDRIMVAVWND